MLQKIPASNSTLKISNNKECFKINEHVKTASRMKVLEFKEKSTGLAEKDAPTLTSKFAQKQDQVMLGIEAIMDKPSIRGSASADFEGLYKSILFISRDPVSMEALTKSIETFAETYHFVEFESL